MVPNEGDRLPRMNRRHEAAAFTLDGRESYTCSSCTTRRRSVVSGSSDVRLPWADTDSWLRSWCNIPCS